MIKSKQAISLIILVLTILMLGIITSTIILTIEDNGVKDKTYDSVNTTNLQQVQELANIAWNKAYAATMHDTSIDLEERVLDELEKNNVDKDKYNIVVTDDGVVVTLKEQ